MTSLRATLARRHGGQDGYTLTEVLVAVVILSVAVTAVVGALGTSIFSSRVHRNLVTGDAAVRAYAAQIAAAGYVSCATPASYPAMTNAPAGITVTITSVAYFNGTATGSNFGSTCGTDQGAQQITVVANPTTAGGQQSLTFVKRAQ
jgi:prepilin-type N-terminal cleavage/methylation domain-containing protein